MLAINSAKNVLVEAIVGNRYRNQVDMPTHDEREKRIENLNGLNIGAYINVWDPPPVRATVMLLGGIAITCAEYINIVF